MMMRNFIGLCAVTVMSVVGGCTSDAPVIDKRVALSFDDAPRGNGPMFTGKARTTVLIEALERAESGPVVFFVTPQGFEKPESRARIARYAANGHLIANHTNTHPWAHKTDTAVYIEDIVAAERALDQLENRRPWFRFPYLDEGRERSKRDAIRLALDKQGLMNGYVTIDTYDWYLMQKWEQAIREGRSVDVEKLGKVYVAMMAEAADFYDKISREVLGRAPEQVILLHENDLAALFIEDLILELRARGWSIIDPDTAYKDPIASQMPDTLFSGQGRIGALAVDQGISASAFDHPTVNESAIDARLEAAGVFGALIPR